MSLNSSPMGLLVRKRSCSVVWRGSGWKESEYLTKPLGWNVMGTVATEQESPEYPGWQKQRAEVKLASQELHAEHDSEHRGLLWGQPGSESCDSAGLPRSNSWKWKVGIRHAT